MSRTRLLLVALLLPLAVQGAVLDSSLGRWLDADAGPELAEVLSKHPRFKGEKLQFTVLDAGKPTPNGNELALAVEQRLTTHLLKRPGVMLAWRNRPTSCEIPHHVPYLIGIEIDGVGSSHRLTISVIDVDEGVWVSGVTLSWSGRLSTEERAAFRAHAATADPGSPENPLPMARASEVAELLADGLSCTHPDGLAGGTHIAASNEVEIQRVNDALHRRFTHSAVVHDAPDAEAASWIAAVTSRPIADGRSELVLTLTPTDDPKATQRLASVYVAGSPVQPPAAVRELVGSLVTRNAQRKGVCKDAGDACAEVSFELATDAYLLAFTTRDQRIATPQCGRAPRLVMAGTRQFRLNVPHSDAPPEHPNASFYVVATTDQALARKIANHLDRAPGNCRAANVSLKAWVDRLGALLAEHGERVSWRAAHIARDFDQVVML